MADRETTIQRLSDAAQLLHHDLKTIDFSNVAAWVYDPLEYAWEPYIEYLSQYVHSPIQSIFLGMNPGPWGMVQTGIPFGEVAAVRDWMKITTSARKPRKEHPKRPVDGLACKRSEVSGKRLWGLFAERYVTPERFFADHFVVNYCPLAFMDEGARNLTPDKFPKIVREPLESACDRHLATVIDTLEPDWCIAVGGFAEACFYRSIPLCSTTHPRKVIRILHPSPASPAANRDWAGQVTRTLEEANVW